MGAGLHGENGGNPRVSLSLWYTYVLPRLTYGLDVLTLSNSSRSCISTREQLIRQYNIYCQVSCLWWQIYISVSWVRWEVCFVVIQLRGNLQNAKFYSKTKNLKVGLPMSVQSYISTTCQVPLIQDTRNFIFRRL